jgi:hypothetical protein
MSHHPPYSPDLLYLASLPRGQICWRFSGMDTGCRGPHIYRSWGRNPVFMRVRRTGVKNLAFVATDLGKGMNSTPRPYLEEDWLTITSLCAETGKPANGPRMAVVRCVKWGRPPRPACQWCSPSASAPVSLAIGAHLSAPVHAVR